MTSDERLAKVPLRIAGEAKSDEAMKGEDVSNSVPSLRRNEINLQFFDESLL